MSQTFNIRSLQFSKSLSPFIKSSAFKSSYLFHSAHFSSLLSQAFTLNSAAKRSYDTHETYSEEFSVSFFECLFEKIISQTEAGGAFNAFSDIHTLQVQDCQFVDCISYGSSRIGNRLSPIGAGAFAFMGGYSEIEQTCFIRCAAKETSHTFHTFINHMGSNRLIHVFFHENAGGDKSGKNLFSMDSGMIEIDGCNASKNVVPDGYAGGYAGYFAISCIVRYSIFERNKGKSIFGACSSGPDKGPHLTFCMFLNNTATQQGIYMRLTGRTCIENAVFIDNKGQSLWGSADISLTRAYFDSPRPNGAIEEDNVAWNWADRLTFKINAEKVCPIINFDTK